MARYIPTALVVMNVVATMAITMAPWTWGR